MKENILDATCGGRSIWHTDNKNRDDVLYIDKREEEPGFTGQENRTFSIEPDEVQDFRDLPYEDGSFDLVVFDPPHVIRENGMKNLSGYIDKSYGALHAETWQADLRNGFEELFRVLEDRGVLIFKFANRAADFREVLDLAPTDPLFGTMTDQDSNCENRFFVFQKNA
jgi:Methyltransferase domain.